MANDHLDTEQLLAQFHHYLETVTPAIPEAPDLFTLLSELSALKAEIKLESRQFKDALEQARVLADHLNAANQQLQQEYERRQQQEQRQQQAAERALLLELLELRDRLQAGQEQAQSYHPTWMARRAKADHFVDAMAEGLTMNLRRLDQMLAKRSVQALTAVVNRLIPNECKQLKP